LSGAGIGPFHHGRFFIEELDQPFGADRGLLEEDGQVAEFLDGRKAAPPRSKTDHVRDFPMGCETKIMTDTQPHHRNHLDDRVDEFPGFSCLSCRWLTQTVVDRPKSLDLKRLRGRRP